MSDLLKYPGESRNDTLSPDEKRAAHSRRTFLFKLTLLLNGAVGAVLAVPLVGYLLGPGLRKSNSYQAWIPLGPVDEFPVGETRLTDFINPIRAPWDGETGRVACWVRRISAEQFQVFAINCAHLGCPVRWFAQSKLFLCPCHGGAYYADGSRASGPPPRGLFEYQYKLAGGNLMIYGGEMPTLATRACLEKPSVEKPLVQIQSVAAAPPTPPSTRTPTTPTNTRPSSWQS
jgi:menaquinol-cytochrome c reductase iron-sulfur subunit